MSTNGSGPPARIIREGGRSVVQEVAGARSASPDEEVIQPEELGYPIGGDPWKVMGFEDPSVMQLQKDVSFSDLRKMTQRDGHARAMLNVLSWPLRAAKRVIEPYEDGEDEADFIRSMLEDPPHRGGMSTTMDYVIASHGLAFRDGFKLFEICTGIRPTRPGEKGFAREILRKLKPLPSDTIAFRYDEFGGFDGAVQTIYWQGEKRVVPLPREKLLLFTVGKEESPLEGESLFLPAYYHYDKKHRLYYIAHIAAQLAATGLRVGKMPGGNKALRNAFFQALKDVGFNGAMLAPPGAEVEVHELKSVLGELLALIEHHDVSMSKSILAHFLDVGTEGKGGLGTATTTSELGDLFVVALEAHLANIAEGITSYLIPYFIDRNFSYGPGEEPKYPTFRFEPFSDDTKLALGEAFKALFNATSQPVPEMMFEVQKSFAEILGLEGIDWDKVKETFDAEQEAQRELKEVARQGQIEAIKNPPEQVVAPGPGQPPPGNKAPAVAPPTKPVKLSELTGEQLQREIALAEAAVTSRTVNDALGRPMVVGDRVTLPDDDVAFEGSAGASLYTIKEVIGSTLVLVRYYGEDPDDDVYIDNTPRARAANSVHLLA